MAFDPDTKTALVIAPIFGGIGSAVERLVSYMGHINAHSLNGLQQRAFLHEQATFFVIYAVVGAVVTTAAITMLPINLQNRRQLVGTSIMFGFVWPSMLDRLVGAISTYLSSG